MRDVAHKETRDETGFLRKTKRSREQPRGSFEASRNRMPVPRGRERDRTGDLSPSLSTAAPFREASYAKFFAYNP